MLRSRSLELNTGPKFAIIFFIDTIIVFLMFIKNQEMYKKNQITQVGYAIYINI